MFFQDIRNLTSYYAAFVITIAQILHKKLYKNNLLPPLKS
jgi:hypothetical protein